MTTMRIEFTVGPPTVAAAVYGVMTLVSEHTSSLARLDDLRVALDELFYALPQDEPVAVHLAVDVDDDRSTVVFRAEARDVVVHPSVASLVDDLRLEHGERDTTATLTVSHR